MSEIDYPSLILPVATHFWGEPNKSLTTSIGARFGSQGSKAIVFAKGTWFDHEQQRGGGVAELVMQETGVPTEAEAHRWLEDQGFIAKDPATPRQPRQVTEDRSDRPSSQPEPQAPPDKATAKGLWTIVEEEPYHTRDGEPLYEVCRVQWRLPDGSWEMGKKGKPKKTFVQRRPSGRPDGSKVYGLGEGEYMRSAPGRDWKPFNEDAFERWSPVTRERGLFLPAVQHTIFHHRELELAIEAGKIILLPEGERKARVAEEFGFGGTTNSGGAANWRDEFAAYFRGADVVIPIDNDEAGRAAGERKAKSLRGIAQRVRVLDFAAIDPTFKPGFDIVDWRDAGGTSDQLEKIIAGLPDYRPRPPQGFGGRSMISLAGKPIEYDWLIKGLVERNGVFILAAEKQAGKSFVVMDMGMKIARGLQYGDRITRKGIVIHVACEDGKGVQMRAEGYRQANGISSDTDIPYVVMTHGFTLMDDKVVDQFIATVKEWEEFYGLPVELIIIDTLSVATEGLNEIDGAEVGKVLARVNRLKDATHAAICLVHHMNASGGRVRGHTSIEANVSQVFEIRPLMTIPNNRRETPQPILDAQGRHIRQIVLTKNKNGLNNLKWRIVLDVVKLGFDADGDEITTCVCARPARAASGSEGQEDATKLEGDRKLVFDALVTAQADKGIDRPEGVSAPPQIRKCVSQQDFVAAVRKVINFTAGEEEIEARNKELQAFLKRTTTALINAGYMGRDNDKRVVWWTEKSDRPRPRREEPPPPEDTRPPISVTEAPF
jgi:hypothetical protein